MSEIPKDLHYSNSHEWVRDEGDNVYTVGITDFAQSQLGDLVFVDLPEVKREIKAGEEVVVLESVKAAADVFCPLKGEVMAINEALLDAPDHVNKDPYGDGWLFRIRVSNGSLNSVLLDATKYSEMINR